MSKWIPIANYGSAFEADLAVEKLRSSGVPANARGNDIVGIFGPGFQGSTARGVDVMVPDTLSRKATLVLGLDARAIAASRDAPVETRGARTLASRGYRLLGQGIDGFIGAAPVLAGLALSRLSGPLSGAVVALAALWSAFYYLFADGLHGGQSFAKQWLGMQVVDEHTGAPCTFWQSFIRNLLLAILGPIDWIFIFGEQHQRLGDKAAGTIVITDLD